MSSKHGSQIIMPPLVRGPQVSRRGNGRSRICMLNIHLDRSQFGEPNEIRYKHCREKKKSACPRIIIFSFDRHCKAIMSQFEAGVVCRGIELRSIIQREVLSTADPGSPPASAATAAVGRLGRWRLRGAASPDVGRPDLSPCWPGSEKHDASGPHQSRKYCKLTGQYLTTETSGFSFYTSFLPRS